MLLSIQIKTPRVFTRGVLQAEGTPYGVPFFDNGENQMALKLSKIALEPSVCQVQAVTLTI